MNKQQIEEFDKKFENIISADLCIRGHYVPTEDSDSRNKIKSFIEKTLQTQKEEFTENIGFLRQWLNEDRIDDTKKMVSNEDIIRFLEMKN